MIESTASDPAGSRLEHAPAKFVSSIATSVTGGVPEFGRVMIAEMASSGENDPPEIVPLTEPEPPEDPELELHATSIAVANQPKTKTDLRRFITLTSLWK
jgi:hypothetical protein